MCIKRVVIVMFVMMLAVVFLPIDQAWAQAAEQDSTGAVVEDIEGEDREVVFTETITAEPARPLIQFTRNRPNVSFSEVKVGQSSRSFFPELRLGSEMEVSAPSIDINVLFPDIIPLTTPQALWPN